MQKARNGKAGQCQERPENDDYMASATDCCTVH